MNERTLENIAIDFWLGKVQRGLVVTETPRYDLHQFFKLIEDYSPNVEINLSRSQVILNGRFIKFCSINSMEDAYKHAGTQYNAMYLGFMKEGFEYIHSRLRSKQGERQYIEYI